MAVNLITTTSPHNPLNISADIFLRDGGWEASLQLHPIFGGCGILIWRKSNMKTQHNAEMAMETVYRKFQRLSAKT